MRSRNGRYQLWEVSKSLTDVAMGRSRADLVIRDGSLLNVYTGEILEHTDVAVKCGRIALVGDAAAAVGEETSVIDAGGRVLVPGFIDGHLHVESSMTTVHEYARLTVPHGTSAVFMDPHEIVNVAGLDGMKAMMEDGATTPLRVYTTTPSCVPASPGLENTGAVVSPGETAATMRWEGIAGLGEMMNYSGILSCDADTCEKVARTLEAGKPVTGHFPVDDTGAALNAYADAGICCCHESTSAAQALAKMRLGMYAMIREGSAWNDLPQVIKAITEHRVDTRLAVLVSDDLHADTILELGHMDYIIRLAIRCGVNPVTAIQMATLNTACCFGLDREIGSIAPGRCADINILGDLAKVRVDRVIIAGETVAENGRMTVPEGDYAYPEELRHTVKITRTVAPEEFEIRAPHESETAAGVRVIGIQESSVLTREIVKTLPVENGFVRIPDGGDVCKAAVINRHSPNGGLSIGFVQGFGLKSGAVASTYAHDAHNLIVLGTNESDMAFAANRLIRCSGGMTAVENGRVLALLEMPIAGLMSDLPAEQVAARLRSLSDAWVRLGSGVSSPFMTMSLLSLVVIPKLRITDKGLVDVSRNRLTSLFVGKPEQQ